MSEQKDFSNFSNSESSCRPDTSHQVSDFPLERRCRLNHFKMTAMGHLGFLNETTFDTSHQVSAKSHFRFRRCCLKNFKMAAMGHEDFTDGCHGGHLGYRNGMVLAIKNRHVDPMPPTKFQLSLTFHLGGNVLNIGTERYRNGTILAILNFHVAPIPPIKCQLNPYFR